MWNEDLVSDVVLRYIGNNKIDGVSHNLATGVLWDCSEDGRKGYGELQDG